MPTDGLSDEDVDRIADRLAEKLGEQGPAADPTSFPGDDQIQTWAERYGTTGVKNHTLRHPANRGCVAVYREMSMAQRQIMGRMETIEEDHPGSYDYQRMIASSCLLHPTIDSYPQPAFAAAELFQRIRAHGHAPLSEEEEIVSGGEGEGALPEHVVSDIKNARENAYRAFKDPRVTSMYQDLILELATHPQHGVDVHVLDYLWRLSPGRLRDVAARVEQANAEVRKQALQVLEEKQKSGEVESEQLQVRAQEIEDTYAPPFDPVDRTVGEAATPDTEPEDGEAAQGEEEAQAAQTEERTTSDSNLPPNQPPPDQIREGIDRAVKESRQ